MKTLHLLRHAKSDWSGDGVADHDRPLNRRGKQARRVIAEHVKDWKVDLVVCSTAQRARATAKPVVAALGCEVRYDDALYEATPGILLTVVRALPDADNWVMLVGHNPTMEEFTELLSREVARVPHRRARDDHAGGRPLERCRTRLRHAGRLRDTGVAARPTLMTWR